MPDFDSGVKSYIKTRAVVEVNFPVSFHDIAYIACKVCPFLTHSTNMCQLTKDIVAYPDKFVGDKCPLQLIKEEEG